MVGSVTGRSCFFWLAWGFEVDVAALKDPSHWAAGMLHVSGKARRQVRLPLPQDVGDAVLAYIERERPRVGEESVFLTMIAPYKPFSISSYLRPLLPMP